MPLDAYFRGIMLIDVHRSPAGPSALLLPQQHAVLDRQQRPVQHEEVAAVAAAAGIDALEPRMCKGNVQCSPRDNEWEYELPEHLQ